jgi:hypothetical protein
MHVYDTACAKGPGVLGGLATLLHYTLLNVNVLLFVVWMHWHLYIAPCEAVPPARKTHTQLNDISFRGFTPGHQVANTSTMF